MFLEGGCAYCHPAWPRGLQGPLVPSSSPKLQHSAGSWEALPPFNCSSSPSLCLVQPPQTFAPGEVSCCHCVSSELLNHSPVLPYLTTSFVHLEQMYSS